MNFSASTSIHSATMMLAKNVFVFGFYLLVLLEEILWRATPTSCSVSLVTDSTTVTVGFLYFKVHLFTY